MFKNLIRLGFTFSVAVVTFSSCEHQDFTNELEDVDRVQVNTISDDMAKVRDYVPRMAVIAHRGSTFWVPEETEAAYRWAREMGADYLEADLQCSKDGVVLALHDDNLCRTTDIENVYGEYIPSTRKQFYMTYYKMTEAQADAQVEADKASFQPYYAKSYMYHELAQLDAGTWFNESSPEQGRSSFSKDGGIHQYISTLGDLINYAKGKKLKRGNDGERVYTITKTGDDPNSYSEGDELVYTFEYADDEEWTGNNPGIYIEFKESWLNPTTFEQDVYDELAKYDYNIMEKPSSETNFYKADGSVNVGNTNGKVILQTFSLESLRRTAGVFKGEIPMCFLLWTGTAATDLIYNTPSGYASFINLGLQYKAHIMGPCIAGAPNNYPEMNAPWQAYLIKKSGMLNHPYSFDSLEQMGKYFGEYNWGNEYGTLFEPPYLDGAFTNRTELTLQYFIDKGVRNSAAAQTVPDATATLERLGYHK